MHVSWNSGGQSRSEQENILAQAQQHIAIQVKEYVSSVLFTLKTMIGALIWIWVAENGPASWCYESSWSRDTIGGIFTLSF
jgi:hypothetical protein